MIEDVIVGVLVEVLAATGRRLGIAAKGRRGQRRREELELARWFDTYKLADLGPNVGELPAGVSGEDVASVLYGDEFQALLHELLAVRLTDAPEIDAKRVRVSFEQIFRPAFPDVDIALLTQELFAYYDGESRRIADELKAADPLLIAQLRDEASSARIVATLHAIERHTAALSTRADPTIEADFLLRYRRHLAEHYGRLEPPDFERRRRIEIGKLYVSPTITQVIEGEPNQQPREIDLTRLDQEIDQTVLLGDPGGGKTTAAQVLVHRHAIDPTCRTPFLVTLREFAAAGLPERSVVSHIEQRLEAFYQCAAPTGMVARLLLAGNALVVFDGLDELVDTSRRAEVTAIIERFCTEYPAARVLVTSRLVGYDQARLDERQFMCYRISGFDDGHVEKYVRNWFAQEELQDSEVDRWTEAFMNESASVSDLRSNPLMLALMCILYRGEGSIPRNRPEVYERCANLLFRKWDARRSIHLELRARHLVEPALRYLAHWLLTSDEPRAAVTERQLVREATKFLHIRGFELIEDAEEAAKEFVSFSRGRMWVFTDAGTTGRGETLFTFTHRTFLEYFAAAHLSAICDTPEKLARTLLPHVAKQEWDVVAALAIQMKDNAIDRGAERIFAIMIADRRRRSVSSRSNILQFLARCLRSIDLPPHVIRNLTRSILDHVFDGHPEESERYLPLSWLLESCIASCELVKEEVAERAGAMIASPDKAIHANGIRLLAWINSGTDIQRDNHRPDDTLSAFWNEFRRESIERNREHIAAIWRTDSGLRKIALEAEIVRIDEILNEEGGLLSLFRFHETGIFGITYVPYLYDHAWCLVRGYKNEDSLARNATQIVQDLQTLGLHIINHADPFPLTDIEGWNNFFSNTHDNGSYKYEIPDNMAYLGALMIILCIAEQLPGLPPDTHSDLSLGPLNEAYRYIMRRWQRDEPTDLPPLPIPHQFHQKLKDWADGRADVVAHSSTRA
ncbi:hypothetical protein Aple_056920 [Acrocarpospora pleiomorpha]|uniref:NACHT domain-containing protein n=1 Tax=Acrocarpospora pleiomorpha TaxID=90975 RepID=A0A5M3XU36_9ACTN|nr:NACHT domain-containing protein [Acrocarpospora pleiomorpha]GES22793.1 hypothetical protein Aple_056920 [Acrocarpospora pleiomorpha]